MLGNRCAPEHSVWLVAEAVVGQLPQGRGLVQDHRRAMEIGSREFAIVVIACFGLMDDTTVHGLIREVS